MGYYFFFVRYNNKEFSNDPEDIYCHTHTMKIICLVILGFAIFVATEGQRISELKGCMAGTFDIKRTCRETGAWCNDSAAQNGCLGCTHCDEYDRKVGKCPECAESARMSKGAPSEEQLKEVAKCLADCTINNIKSASAIQQCAAGCQPNNGAPGIEAMQMTMLLVTVLAMFMAARVFFKWSM